MKLISAHINGFRILDNLKIEFSTDKKRNITVVRAANESGKTTLLTALQWGLIGDDALPAGYSLRHMDLASTTLAKTEVEIEYEIENRDGPQTYRIIRSVETMGGSQPRPKSSLDLFHIRDSGAEPEKSPYNHIQQHFPAELREVFFTDGDRALSFIEGPRAEQQHKVKAAIKKMMGLSMLESTSDHIKNNEKKLRTKFDQEAGNSETHKVKAELEAIDNRLPELKNELDKIIETITNLSGLHQKADRELQEALKLGNREELARDLKNTQAQRVQIEKQRRLTEMRQSDLLSSTTLAKHMFSNPFSEAANILNTLREKGEFPKETVPILEDRLELADCICGESLDENTNEGKRRRDNIIQLIEESREADSIRATISKLFYEGKPLFSGKLDSWNDLYSSVFEERQRMRTLYEDIGEQEAELEAKLKSIPDTNVQRLREIRLTYSDQLTDQRINGTKCEEVIKRKKNEKTVLEKQFRSLSANVEKGKKIALELEVATDMRGIVDRALDRMKTLEVNRVSNRMNELFLQMIGAAEESSLITKAEISPEFRIVVYGRNNSLLDPSMDLNGASRRALTIAFVLALTEVSGVEAPNVIDTPLGMMSGFVKTEVVKTASQNSAQLILFLTHDEIKGCEGILDESSALGITFTNPTHYPKILINDPNMEDAVVLACKCDHRSTCNICERRESSENSKKKVA